MGNADMADMDAGCNIGTITPATIFPITPEPDWPHDPYCSRFSFGGPGPNLSLLAGALTPPTPAGSQDLAARILMEWLLWAFHVAKRRKQHPSLGQYRWIWRDQPEIALATGLSLEQVKRCVARLRRAGIIVTERPTATAMTHYSLTDEAFMMAHVLRYPSNKLDWLMHEFHASEQANDKIVAKDCQHNREAWQKDFPKVFPSVLASDDIGGLLLDWHRGPHRSDPRTIGIIEIWEATCGRIFRGEGSNCTELEGP